MSPAKNCKNCQTPLKGEYCFSCGQHSHVAAEPTLHDIFHEFTHEFLHLNGKIFLTMKLLFTQPGELTREFLRGKRAKYIGPLRLYLTMSILYFLIGGLHVNLNVTETHSINVEKSAHKGNQELLDSIDPGLALEKPLEAIKKNPKQFEQLFRTAYPKAIFCLIPVFAYILSLSYFRRRKNYPQYLYFALHYHAALFGGLVLLKPLEWLIFIDTDILWPLWAFTYLVLALKRVWKDSLRAAILRTISVGLVYLIFFVAALPILIFYSIEKIGAH